MTSNINTSGINVNFPVQGGNNSSQTFRNNSSNIVANFNTAATEISNIQNKYIQLTGSITSNAIIGSSNANVVIQTTGTQPYDIAVYVPSTYTSGQVLSQIQFARTVTFANNFSPSLAYLPPGSYPTGSVTVGISKNGTSIGSIAFAAGASSGVFTSVNTTTTINSGDILVFTGPNPSDPTFSYLSITLSGSRVF